MVTITKTFSYEPDPIDISNKLDFQNNYERTFSHLLTAWCMIFGIGIFFCGATAVVLRRKDV